MSNWKLEDFAIALTEIATKYDEESKLIAWNAKHSRRNNFTINRKFRCRYPHILSFQRKFLLVLVQSFYFKSCLRYFPIYTE